MKSKIFLIGCTIGALLVGCSGDSKKDSQTASIETNSSVPVTPITKTEAGTNDAGETLYKTKCASCHGDDAKGRADFPKLVGQSKSELLKKLNGYKDGTYGNKMKAVMEPNAKALSSTQIEMLVDYILKK